jgi:hypothetical protein
VSHPLPLSSLCGVGDKGRRRSVTLLVNINNPYAFRWMAAAAACVALEFKVKKIEIVVQIMTFHA